VSARALVARISLLRAHLVAGGWLGVQTRWIIIVGWTERVVVQGVAPKENVVVALTAAETIDDVATAATVVIETAVHPPAGMIDVIVIIETTAMERTHVMRNNAAAEVRDGAHAIETRATTETGTDLAVPQVSEQVGRRAERRSEAVRNRAEVGEECVPAEAQSVA
jgi:hypothetical protein